MIKQFYRILLLTLFLIASCSLLGQTNDNHVFVRGYHRADGIYVKPHYRTAPNNTPWDNFSTIGNVNPYTGEVGKVVPNGRDEISNSSIAKASNEGVESVWRNLSDDYPKMPDFVILGKANIRSQPDSDSPLLFSLNKESLVKVVSFGRPWIQVATWYGGEYHVGFVHETLIKSK
jgi:hypothetical protein